MRRISGPTIALAILLLGFVAGCAESPKDYALEDWERLDASERAELMRGLGEAEGRLLMLGALQIGLSGDTVGVKQRTVGEVIEVGRRAKERDASSQ